MLDAVTRSAHAAASKPAARYQTGSNRENAHGRTARATLRDALATRYRRDPLNSRAGQKIVPVLEFELIPF
jgi:hypothetical protein